MHADIKPSNRLDCAATSRSLHRGDLVTVEVVLTGELDISTFDKAEKQVEEAEQEAPDLLIIDLAELYFVDSTGVRLILLADQRAQQARRRLAIRLGRGPALRVFAMLGLTDRFDVLDEEANDASPGPTRA